MNIEVVIFTNNNENTIHNLIREIYEIMKPIKYTVYDNLSTDNTIDIIEKFTIEHNILLDIFKSDIKNNDELFYNKYCQIKLQEFNSDEEKRITILRGHYCIKEYLHKNMKISDICFSSYYVLSESNHLIYQYPLILTTNEIWSIDVNNNFHCVPKTTTHETSFIGDRVCLVTPKTTDTLPIEYVEKQLYDTSKEKLNKKPYVSLCLLYSAQNDVNRAVYYLNSYIALIDMNCTNEKNQAYYLCFKIMDSLIQNKIYDRKIITTIAKKAISMFSDRAEIYNRLGIFYYKIQSYYLSYYYYEIALSKKIKDIDLSTTNHVHLDAYTINNNSEIIIVSLILKKKKEFLKYKELYEKECNHNNKKNVLQYINQVFLQLH
jgi:hypothetical protein